MNTPLAIVFTLTLTLTPLLAQVRTDVSAAINAPATTNAIAVTNSLAVTNAPATTNALATTDASTNKVDIKELTTLPSFTNATGMVMVKISETLWAGAYEVTQEEYQKIAGANPSKFQGARNPVDSVSWNDARNFCAGLDAAEQKEEMLPEGFGYTFPTEAQWESLLGGAQLKDAVTSEKSSRPGTSQVGSLGPNSLGLYDTRGNVWEFCLHPQDKQFRVLRGGAWNTSYEPNLRTEFRWFAGGPDERKENYGFRCLLAPKQ
jgi:formylglycine-generating enzyme required for sulfatase activity